MESGSKPVIYGTRPVLIRLRGQWFAALRPEIAHRPEGFPQLRPNANYTRSYSASEACRKWYRMVYHPTPAWARKPR